MTDKQSKSEYWVLRHDGSRPPKAYFREPGCGMTNYIGNACRYNTRKEAYTQAGKHNDAIVVHVTVKKRAGDCSQRLWRIENYLDNLLGPTWRTAYKETKND